MKEFLPEEDKDVAFDYIILQLLVSALTKDINAIKTSKLKLKDTHVTFMESILDLVIKDLSKIKKVMYKKGIKVFDPVSINEDFWSYKYVIRGYECEFRCFKSGLKMSTEKKLSRYYSLVSHDPT